MFEQDLKRFEWTKFYEELANSLLHYHADKDRPPLIEAIQKISLTNENVKKFLSDPHPDDPEALLNDICPFTVFSLFNRKSMTEVERQSIAMEIANILGVSQDIPENFNGIPVLNNQHSHFFDDREYRKPDAIEVLWSMFENAIQFADFEDSDIQFEKHFSEAYNRAITFPWVKWNLITGLHWIRPWKFVSLDKKSKLYIDRQPIKEIINNTSEKIPEAKDYLSLRNDLLNYFKDDSFAVHSFPELSLAACNYEPPEKSKKASGKEFEEMTEDLMGLDQEPDAPYSLESIIGDGCFLGSLKLEEILKRLKTKKKHYPSRPSGTR